MNPGADDGGEPEADGGMVPSAGALGLAAIPVGSDPVVPMAPVQDAAAKTTSLVNRRPQIPTAGGFIDACMPITGPRNKDSFRFL